MSTSSDLSVSQTTAPAVTNVWVLRAAAAAARQKQEEASAAQAAVTSTITPTATPVANAKPTVDKVVAASVAAPVSTPVSTSVATPVSTSVAAPVSTSVAATVSTSVAATVSTSVDASVGDTDTAVKLNAATDVDIRSIGDLLKYMRSRQFPSKEAAVNELKQALDGYNISFRDSSDDPRVLLSSNRNQSLFNLPIHHQCNGLILDTDNWKILATSNPMFNPKPNFKFVGKNFSKYTIYPVLDGTVINLYYYKDEWRMGSCHAYDIGSYYWMGTKSYHDLFNEVLAKTTLTYDDLDKTKCYIMGFRHFNVHPFKTDSEKIWFIDSYEMSNDTPKRCFEDVVAVIEAKGIQVQRPVTIGFAELTRVCKEAYVDNQKSAAKITYGFILRGRFSECGENSHILYESTLLKKIRKLMYNMPKPCDKIGQIAIDNVNRMNFMALRAYLDYNSRATFIKLFPQFAPLFIEYKSFIERLANRILQCYRNKFTQKNVMTPKVEPKKEHAIIDRLAQTFVSQMKGKERLDPYDNVTREVIIDNITNVNYIALYSCLLKCNLK
jgi:hypothetical protein